MTGTEAFVAEAISWMKLGAETLGAFIAGVGVLAAAACIVRGLASWDPDSYRRARLRLSHFLVLALEFQLAADILATSIAPSWDQLGRLGAIAVIRTFLNFFLSHETSAIEQEETIVAATGKEKPHET